MYTELVAPAAAIVAALIALLACVLVLRLAARVERLRGVAEQALAGQRSGTETVRAALTATERALTATIQAGNTDGMGRALEAIQSSTRAVGLSTDRLRTEIGTTLGDLRTAIEARLREMREGNEAKLAQIQQTVNEQLHAAVEKQMAASFTRVADQFAAVQKAMGDVQAVTAQIGDIKRLFSNVKTRGGWGETQVRALLDDVLPPGRYEANWRPRADSGDAVEFAVLMPMRGAAPPRLPIDSKFPLEDYERLLAAAEAGDAEAERAARRGLERCIREQAKRITKYIASPATVDFAVMYLPSDGLYTEAARIPGLIDEIGRSCRVLVLGPSLFPALLHSIVLGHVTLDVERRAEEVRELLGATVTEMKKMDEVLARVSRQAGTIATTIESARTRTRQVTRKLRGIEALDAGAAELLLGTELDEAEPSLEAEAT
ncbi:MAG TPA: DNA recombination protein RmuC [Acetobacteraceae bacterium]|jgi:DNA recombination protein RmuC|nr:DNA recombination protein RmuC [Acetobacteraceae bacterium]